MPAKGSSKGGPGAPRWLRVLLCLLVAWLMLLPALLAVFPARAQQPGARHQPDIVEIGAYLNDVQAIDLRAHNFMIDFYVWFRWRNPGIDPSNTLEFVNHSESWGTIITKAYETPESLPDGGLYQVIHVQGRMSRKMDLRDYPFDRQVIAIEMEDAVGTAAELVYQVDRVSANPRLQIPGFRYQLLTMTAYTYRHPTTFGDPRAADGGAYSRVSIELPIVRPAVNAMIKNLLPILLTVICCSFVFLLDPGLVDSRFQIAIFSLISIVALQITVGADLPTIEYLTLLDEFYILAYLYCIAVIGLLVHSTRISRNPGGTEAAMAFDRRGGVVLFLVYLVMCAAVTVLSLAR